MTTLRITLAGVDTNNNFSLTFTTVTGKLYAIDTNFDLTIPAGWQPFTNNLPGTGAPLTITTPNPLIFTNLFYRVRLQP